MIVAGFGFRASARLESLQDALSQAASGRTIAGVATLSDKAATPVFQDFANQLNLLVHPIDPAALEGLATPTQSAAVQAARQTGSVAEACALAAAGPGAEILQTRVISEDRLATCALAQVPPTGDKP